MPDKLQAMSKGNFNSPDELFLNPLVALLPKKGAIEDLARFKPSFFARLQKVQSIKKQGGEEMVKDEGPMIKEVLEWIAENF